MKLNLSKSGIYILTFVVIATIFVYFNKYNQQQPSHPLNKNIQLETFYSGKGWGYRIIKDGRIYINQSYIPAIPGNHPFVSEEDAKNIGQIVLRKVENREIPSINKKLLDSLNVRY